MLKEIWRSNKKFHRILKWKTCEAALPLPLFLSRRACSGRSLVSRQILVDSFSLKPQAAEPHREQRWEGTLPWAEHASVSLSETEGTALWPKTVGKCQTWQQSRDREGAQVVWLFAVQSQWVPVSSPWHKEMLHLPDFGDNCRDAVGPEVKKPKQGAYLFSCLVVRNSI